MQREAEVRAGKAVGSGLSTTFTPMSDWITEITDCWITDCLPTEADGDRDGDVWVRIRPDHWIGMHRHWSHVGIGTPWQRSHLWRPPAPQPEPAARAMQSRRFVSISRTVHDHGHTLDAIADDGTAWWKDADHTEWRQLSPLPARELPTEPEF